jgi:peptidoglycan/LPS O-acetylase OafA/YrhL
MCARQAQLGALQAWQTPIRTLAGYTFTLYLVHGLVMGLWEQFAGPPSAGALEMILLTICIGAVTYACGILTDRLRAAIRRRCEAAQAAPAERLA